MESYSESYKNKFRQKIYQKGKSKSKKIEAYHQQATHKIPTQNLEISKKYINLPKSKSAIDYNFSQYANPNIMTAKFENSKLGRNSLSLNEKDQAWKNKKAKSKENWKPWQKKKCDIVMKSMELEDSEAGSLVWAEWPRKQSKVNHPKNRSNFSKSIRNDLIEIEDRNNRKLKSSNNGGYDYSFFVV